MKFKMMIVFIFGLVFGFLSAMPILLKYIQESEFNAYLSYIVETNMTIVYVENNSTEALLALQKPLLKVFLCNIYFLEKEYFWIDNDTIQNDTRIKRIMEDTKLDLNRCPELAGIQVEV